MKIHEAAPEVSLDPTQTKRPESPNFSPVAIKHLSKTADCPCCWYNSSTDGCS